MNFLKKKENQSLFFAKDEFIFLLNFLYTSNINIIFYIILNILQTFQIIYYQFLSA